MADPSAYTGDHPVYLARSGADPRTAQRRVPTFAEAAGRVIRQEVNKKLCKLFLHPSGVSQYSVIPTVFQIVVSGPGVGNWQDFKQRETFGLFCRDQYIWRNRTPVIGKERLSPYVVSGWPLARVVRPFAEQVHHALAVFRQDLPVVSFGPFIWRHPPNPRERVFNSDTLYVDPLSRRWKASRIETNEFLAKIQATRFQKSQECFEGQG